MSRSVVGYTNDTLNEKIVYTGIDSDTAITLVDNDSESPTFGSIKVDVRPEVLGDRIESGDSSIGINTDSSGTKKISVNISSDPDNIITLEEDGINVSSEDLATEEELQEIKDTFASKEWVEDYVDGLEFVTEEDLDPIKEEISGKQDKLIAGDNITIENNVISADASSIKYNYRDLTGKPKINGIELNGNKSSEDLDITLQNLGINDYDFATKTELHNEVSDSSAAIHNWVESNYRTKANQDIIDAGKQDVINDLESIRSGAAKGATSVQPEDISDMATKIWVNDQEFAKDSDLSTVAKTGEYDDLTGVPTKTSDFINDGEGDLDSSGLYIPFSTMSDISRLDNRIDELVIEGGEPNKINHITVNGTEISPGSPDKTVRLTIPTETSDLTNDSGFITNDVSDLTNYYTKTEVDTGFYTKDQVYTKTEIDADHYNKDEVDVELSKKQNELTAGTGISIEVDSSGQTIISNTQTSAEWGNIEGNLEDQIDLANALDSKVDKVEGYSLMSEAEHEKLEGIEDYAQVNIIDRVDLDDFTIDSSKQLQLNNINISKVTGLEEALNDKVDKVSGYSLMSESEHSKLGGIGSGAQVNILEGVKVNGTVQTITDKEVDITVPTKVSDLDNDLDFQAGAEVEASISDNNTNYVDVELSKKQDELTAGDGIDIYTDSTGALIIENTNVSAEWGNIQGTLSNQTDLQNALDGKVDKEVGYSLMSDAEHTKLEDIESGAQVNIIEEVKVNGTSLTVTDKSVDVTVPTNISDLTNDSNFQTETEVESSINTAISTNNESYVDVELSKKQDELTAGEGIDISQDSSGALIISNTKTSAEWGNITGTLSNQEDLQSALNNKVDTELGYGLSKNDFTDALKGKLDAIESGAEVNVIEDVKVNGTSIEVSNKSVDITIPTNISSFTNDSDYQTGTEVTSSISTHNSSVTAHGDIRQLVSSETTNRENADTNLQEQIDAITSSSDVVDIVGTYAELQSYDTSHLNNNDIVKVLLDSTHSNAISYYRWVFTLDSMGQPVLDSMGNHVGSWDYIGSQGPFYTKSETDQIFVPQTRTVNNKALSSNIALDYSDVGALPSNTVIGNGTVTIQKNGTTIDSFTLNQDSDKNINISIPTKTSDISNDSGFLAFDDLVGGTNILITQNSSGVVIDNTMKWGDLTGTLANQTDLQSALNAKQNLLDSGTTIKTIENQSILGSGNIDITASDVGLGSVVNTGDSDTPLENGTDKFTTGGAYNLKAYVDSKHDIYYGTTIPSSSFGNDGDVFVLYS